MYPPFIPHPVSLSTRTSQSPAPGKKGKATPAKAKVAPPTEAPPTEPTVTMETPEQLAHRQRMCQLYKEHKAAIEREGTCMYKCSHHNSIRVDVVEN